MATTNNSSVIVLTDNSFEKDVLKSELPVLVDFWATWCGPCKAIAPFLEALATENLGKIKIGKLDVDGNRETAAKYHIKGIPTLILFKDGNALATKTGFLSKAQLQEFLDNHLD